MRLLMTSLVAAAWLASAISALAQSSAAAPAAVPAPAPANNSAAAVPVALGKRLACMTAAQGLQGQDRQDQMQLCTAQARLDCLKQAIDQKIVGPDRRDYVRNCTQQ